MSDKGKPAIILAIATAILVVLSCFSWEDLTKNLFKSFDLFADAKGTAPTTLTTTTDYLDPDLAMLEDTTRYEYIDTPAIPATDTIVAPSDTVVEPIACQPLTGQVDSIYTPGAAPQPVEPRPEPQPQPQPVLTAGTEAAAFLIDYSAESQNLKRLRAAFAKAWQEQVRIAVIGDSYIEGDIFTDEVRSRLQTHYGGSGIGYTPVFSEIPGFRNSVVHTCNDFEALDFRTNKEGRKYSLLQGYAFKALDGAAATFTGTNKIAGADSWTRSRILLTLPGGGSIKVRTGKDTKEPWQTFTFTPSDSLRAIEIDGLTSRLSIRGITPGAIIEGVYLDSDRGVLLDNMSIRGYAGIRHDEISPLRVDQARKYVDYDLIVLEFGINALSASQTNYASYVSKMTTVINHIKKLYPGAVVMIMGIGDRGEKRGAEVHSMLTVPNMVEAQRNIARNTGSLFWDTRAAMGGQDAVVEWSDAKYINKDYVHLSHAGGRKLGEIFVNSLNEALK